MRLSRCIRLVLGGAALALTITGAAGAQEISNAPTTDLAKVTPWGNELIFENYGNYEGLEVKISGPGGTTMEERFGGFLQMKVVRKDGSQALDGRYSFEIRPIVELSRQVRDQALAAREESDLCTLGEMRALGLLPDGSVVQWGYFVMDKGAVVLGGEDEPQRRTAPTDTLLSSRNSAGTLGGQSTDGGVDLALRDFVINDDLIVDGSACIGFDCVNGEVFSFDTLRLKENNLRIKFDDTSVAGSFPRTDWQLTANDSANGGASKFSIDDISGGRTPFTVEANAPSHSLYVDDGGRLGFGTSTPVADLHVVDGDTPTLRLEQNGSSGFAPQTWDLAGNETSFFIRDASNGSTLPFRIRPSAPSNALVIDADGDVGVSTLTADAALHVKRTNNTALLLIEDTGNAAQDVLRLVNNGVVRFRMEDTDSGNNWQFRVGANSWNASKDGTGGNEFEILNDGTVNMGPGGSGVFNLTPAGNLTVAGTVTPGSDRNRKKNIELVDPNDILNRLLAMPVNYWTFNHETDEIRHVGPMAQDFMAAFGLGASEKHIGVLDATGVTMAAIQALHQQVETKDVQVAELKEKNAELEARLAALEEALNQQ